MIIIIFLIFIFLLSLVFNEIIEINCFGLSKNTKRNIMNRALREDYYSSNEEIDVGNENDDEINKKDEACENKKNFPLLPINNTDNTLVNNYN